MNALSLLIKFTAIGLLAGFLTNTHHSLGNDVWAMVGLMVVVGTLLAGFELRMPGAAKDVAAEAA